jgi:hypothetical protein
MKTVQVGVLFKHGVTGRFLSIGLWMAKARDTAEHLILNSVPRLGRDRGSITGEW